MISKDRIFFFFLVVPNSVCKLMFPTINVVRCNYMTVAAIELKELLLHPDTNSLNPRKVIFRFYFKCMFLISDFYLHLQVSCSQNLV